MIEWKISQEPISYPEAIDFMEARVGKIIAKEANEMIWLLQHPHVYTAGTGAAESDLLRKDIPVYQTGRGGKHTYHGPGQRVAYAMVDLKERDACDVRLYVHNLEEWVINSLADFGIKGERREGRVGIWVINPKSGREEKIAALGVRLRKWVTFHGVAINLNPDMSYFGGIIPCGIKEYGVTSFEKLGVKASMDDLDQALKNNWEKVFK